MRPWSYQCFKPGNHYKSKHFECGGPRKGKLLRHFTWITYLNDINENGETELVHQGIKIKPEEGLLLIFKHSLKHEALKVNAGVKYIYRSNWLISR